MKGCVYHLKLLLTLASAVILGSKSRGTHDNISLFQILDSPNLEGQVPVCISPMNEADQLYPQALGGPNRKHRFQQFSVVATRVRCLGKFYRPFLNNRRVLWLHYPILSAAMSQFHVPFHRLLVTIHSLLNGMTVSYIYIYI
jgi:hypothetical protein